MHPETSSSSVDTQLPAQKKSGNTSTPAPSSSPLLPSSKSKRGFASMSRERQREIASMGGKALPAHKRSFSQNRLLASESGRKGGQSVPGEKRAFSKDKDLAVKAGREGGLSVPEEKRSFSLDRKLAQAAGRKGGLQRHR